MRNQTVRIVARLIAGVLQNGMQLPVGVMLRRRIDVLALARMLSHELAAQLVATNQADDTRIGVSATRCRLM